MLVFLLMFSVATFSFQSEGKKVEGYLVMPASKPKAIVLYFHRAIEDRNAVKDWANLMGPHGYVVAGYTATSATDFVAEARSAIASLRAHKELSRLPLVIVGASLGTRAAARLFAADPEARALVLIVPSSTEACKISKMEKRPIFLIQAEKDEVVGNGEGIHQCLPAGTKYLLLKATGHRFPPSLISTQILEWLDSMITH